MFAHGHLGARRIAMLALAASSVAATPHQGPPPPTHDGEETRAFHFLQHHLQRSIKRRSHVQEGKVFPDHTADVERIGKWEGDGGGPCQTPGVMSKWAPEHLQLGKPFFLHVPHNSIDPDVGKKRADAMEGVSKLPHAVNMPASVAFVFASNRNETTPLAMAYKRLGIPYHQIAEQYFPWNWFAKVGPLVHALQHNITSEYIIFTDADDMFPISHDFSTLIEQFESYNASIVLGSTHADFPHDASMANFDRCVYPWADGHVHGQSSYMARRDYLLRVLPGLKPSPHFDDQRELRRLHAEKYPEIKVDTLTRIFVRDDRWRYQL